jgi:hypothetical protein
MRATKAKRLCARHRRIFPAGDKCPECKREKAELGKPRRQANSQRLGRFSPHWRTLSFNMIRRHRRDRGPYCPRCLRVESEHDPSTKLTVDLVRGGDHTTALEEECEVVCRRCHGQAQGARRRA